MPVSLITVEGYRSIRKAWTRLALNEPETSLHRQLPAPLGHWIAGQLVEEEKDP